MAVTDFEVCNLPTWHLFAPRRWPAQQRHKESPPRRELFATDWISRHRHLLNTQKGCQDHPTTPSNSLRDHGRQKKHAMIDDPTVCDHKVIYACVTGQPGSSRKNNIESVLKKLWAGCISAICFMKMPTEKFQTKFPLQSGQWKIDCKVCSIRWWCCWHFGYVLRTSINKCQVNINNFQ